MKITTGTAMAITLTAALLAGTTLAKTDDEGRGRGDQRRRGRDGESGGEHQGRNRKGNGELKAFRMKQRKAIRAHREQQQAENKEFREANRDGEPVDALPGIIAHTNTQFKENQDFMDKMHQEFITFVKELMAKREAPEEKQEERIAKMEENQEGRATKHEEVHDKLIAALEALQGQDDLTWKDIQDAMRAARPERDGNGHDGRRGRGHGEGRRRNRDGNRGRDDKTDQTRGDSA